jgi:hypothetical protein
MRIQRPPETGIIDTQVCWSGRAGEGRALFNWSGLPGLGFPDPGVGRRDADPPRRGFLTGQTARERALSAALPAPGTLILAGGSKPTSFFGQICAGSATSRTQSAALVI